MKQAVLTRLPCLFLFALSACAEVPDGADLPDAIRILPLGDSITEGNRFQNSYRRPLWLALTEAGYPVDFVGTSRRNHLGGPPAADFDRDHEGHWEWRIDEVARELPGWLAAMPTPDIALVHLGSNDLFRGEPIDQMVGEMRDIVRLLREANPGMVLLVADIIPASGTVERTAAYNHGLTALLDLGTDASPVVTVDLFTGFDPATLTYDGVHPNDAGEAWMAERWKAALIGALARFPHVR